MSPTTITPGDGAGILYTQQGIGTTPGYSAIDIRRILGALVASSGSLNPGAYAVSQRGSGANMSVDIAATVGTLAIVGTTITDQGVYLVPPHSATINEIIGPADPTNPRIDTVIMQCLDNVVDGSAGDRAQTIVIPGATHPGLTVPPTNAADAATDGAGTVPASSVALAYVLVPAGATSITNADIVSVLSPARGGIAQLAPRFTAVSITANPGELTIPTAVPVTITLPAPVAGSVVAIEAPGGATGAAPVTVSPHASETIYGDGLNANVSFLLGTPGASVRLEADGTNWRMTAGEQDSGWVTLTGSPGTVTAVSGGYAPSVRVRGDMVSLSGGFRNGTGGNISGASFTTVPANAVPAQDVSLMGTDNSGTPQALPLFVNTSGQLGVTGTWTAAHNVSFDGASYRLV